jgi:hypothetical protein
MNEIILAPCDAGYVQSCTGLVLNGQLSVFKKDKLFYINCGNSLMDAYLLISSKCKYKIVS